MLLKRPRNFCINFFHVWGGERKFKFPCLKERKEKILFWFYILTETYRPELNKYPELHGYSTVLSTGTVQYIKSGDS